MRQRFLFSILNLMLMFSCLAGKPPVIETSSLTPMPDQWIDKDTGHKVMHLTQRKGDNRSFYFHNNPFLPAISGVNEKMIFFGKVGDDMQLFSVDMKTRAADQITNKKAISGEIVGVKHREVYSQCRDSVFASGIENHKTRLIYVFPETARGHVTTLNADETLLAGALNSPEEDEILKKYPGKHNFFTRIYEAKLLRTLYTVPAKGGNLKPIHSENARLNHVRFSPDGKWIIFRANFEGHSDIYAVEI